MQRPWYEHQQTIAQSANTLVADTSDPSFSPTTDLFRLFWYQFEESEGRLTRHEGKRHGVQDELRNIEG